MRDVVRVRIACSVVINATVTTLRTTPRPPTFPGVQRVGLVDFEYRGRMYPDSVHVEDVVLFVSHGDVEDSAYYAGEDAAAAAAAAAATLWDGSRSRLQWLRHAAVSGMLVCSLRNCCQQPLSRQLARSTRDAMPNTSSNQCVNAVPAAAYS